MTPEQDSKVITLRERFARRREQAMQDWGAAGTALSLAQLRYDAAGNEWHALDTLVTANDATLLQIAETLQ